MSGVRYLDQDLFDQLAQAAHIADRQRHHHVFHLADEPCHRMAVGLQPDTYIAPHRHLAADKAEHLIVLRGRLGLLIFDEQGQLESARELAAGGECVGVDLLPGVYHALVVLEPDTMLFECKAGPYRPLTEDEHAAWAPREGDPDAAAYRDWLRGHFAL